MSAHGRKKPLGWFELDCPVLMYSGHSPNSNSMNNIRNIPWSRILGEGIIIVVSILLAFWIQAWWEDAKDAERERAHLEALQVEFKANLKSLESNIARLESIKSAAVSLIYIIEGKVDRPSVDSLSDITWEAFSFPPYEPRTTAYENLISTGDISLIRDESLKSDLAVFASTVETYRRGEIVLVQWNTVVQQFVAREFEPLDWLPEWFREDHGLPPPETRTDWDRLLVNREFGGILANRIIGCDDDLDNLNDVLPAAERIVAQLEALLAE